MQVRYEPKAIRDMRSLPVKVRRQIDAKIEAYAKAPESLRNNIKRLQGSEYFRLRVGNYRVIFSIENGQVTIMVVQRVRHRKEAYD
ncbi:type II toxin-antitoxin system RelE/ParE family toxin [Thalassospira sp. MA62]|nr:type II toxin-antitoxin system RelE/ParE family toxin [Thalassospira sp. MA62]